MQSKAGILLCLFSLLPLSAGADEDDSSFENAVLNGKTHIDFRYRYEWVDSDALAKDANASTLRLRINYATDTWSGWSAFIEADHVAEVLINDFNSSSGTSPGREQYPVVADPRGTDLNQFYLNTLAPPTGASAWGGKESCSIISVSLAAWAGVKTNKPTMVFPPPSAVSIEPRSSTAMLPMSIEYTVIESLPETTRRIRTS